MSLYSSEEEIDFSEDPTWKFINQKIRMLKKALTDPNICQETKYFTISPNMSDEIIFEKFEKELLLIAPSNVDEKKKYEKEINERIKGLNDFLDYYKRNDGYGAQVDPYLIGPIPHLIQYRENPNWEVVEPTQFSEEEASEATDEEASFEPTQPTQQTQQTQLMNLEPEGNEETELQRTFTVQESSPYSESIPTQRMDLGSPEPDPQLFRSPDSPVLFPTSDPNDSQTNSEDHEALEELMGILTPSPGFPLAQQPKSTNTNTSQWYIT